jgi:excinuclease UvrABC nuclease subunit
LSIFVRYDTLLFVTLEEFKSLVIPDEPGVYRFLGPKREILYIGKATSLRDRTKSYFSDDLLKTRGKHMIDMVTHARSLVWTTTGSALEALILESTLIKKHQPPYNLREKDDKSYHYLVITNEEYPRVFTIRERTMRTGGDTSGEYMYEFGPFVSGGDLATALRIVRRMLPFRDKCAPGQGKPCFDRQIGLCPGVCTGEITREEYARRIRHIALFFQGKKTQVIRGLEREMHRHAKALEFEAAAEYKRMLFSLKHIKDVMLLDHTIKEVSARSASSRRRPYRIEAYDIAHIFGTDTVGVMTVVEGIIARPSEYRKFRIKDATGANDPKHLAEILFRRLNHPEWRAPDLIVVDGGVAQRNRAMSVMREMGMDIPVVSVVKDARHKPKDILGPKEIVEVHKKAILLANQESHRFAVEYHRKRRAMRSTPNARKRRLSGV